LFTKGNVCKEDCSFFQKSVKKENQISKVGEIILPIIYLFSLKKFATNIS
jgi:hypothetical protein